MITRTIGTDYFVVGCGAAGMAFTDELIGVSDAKVVMVDRRHAPGGHWLEAYPFVRLHQPSSYYGVNSLPLGDETIDAHGPNRGMYERATAPEICAYYRRVMDTRLLPTGRVHYFPMCEVVGRGQFVSRLSGQRFEVKVRKKWVDASYLQPAIPASYPPPFEVAEGVRCVPVGGLVRAAEKADGLVVIGAGKTAADACAWLLQVGVAPEAITWIKPREAWFTNRAFAQGGTLVASILEGLALQVEAAARASSFDELFVRLEPAGQLLRVDERVMPTMFKGATMSMGEIEELRSIEKVVRLGKVRRIERDTIVLDRGTLPTSPQHLHVHCAAPGLNPAPAVPIFAEDRITLQSIRTGLAPFAAALIAYVEATREDITAKNQLCPPNAQPDSARDWVRSTLASMRADYLWLKEPDLGEWLDRSRLNPSRGLSQHDGEPRVQQARKRFLGHVGPGLARLEQLL